MIIIISIYLLSINLHPFSFLSSVVTLLEVIISSLSLIVKAGGMEIRGCPISMLSSSTGIHSITPVRPRPLYNDNSQYLYTNIYYNSINVEI